MQRIVLAAALAIALTACGQEPAAEAEVRPAEVAEDASVDEVAPGSVAVPENLPAFVTLYPGLTLTTAYGGTTAQGVGGTVVGVTPDGMDEVAAFYRDALKAADMGAVSETNLPGTRMLSGGEPDQRVLSVILTDAEGGGTQVALQYAQTGG